MKEPKIELISQICLGARILRKNTRYPNLSHEELVQLLSWIMINSDLAEEAYQKIQEKRNPSKWKKRTA